MFIVSYILSTKLRWLVFIISLLLAAMALASVVPTAAKAAACTLPQHQAGETVLAYDDISVITTGISKASDKISEAADSGKRAIRCGYQSSMAGIGESKKYLGHTLQNGALSVALAVNGSLSFMTQASNATSSFIIYAAVHSVAVMAHTSGDILGFVPDTPIVSSIIKPASAIQVPVIDSQAAAVYASHAPLPVVESASHTTPPPASAPVWPLLGDVTTLFGVPHWPWQPTHTGLDISSGRPSGVMPIRPFKPGKVIETVYSRYGLGNYVTVDHGEGMTSVYAHLSSLSVDTGQAVDLNTVLGYEGNTGASTGPHLHFEIRLDGRPVNPQPYLGGR